jgi:hypothetical protein
MDLAAVLPTLLVKSVPQETLSQKPLFISHFNSGSAETLDWLFL